MNKAELFVEILVEELPAIPFLREFKNFHTKWESVLKEFGICAKSEFYYTPRRIVIWCKDFPLMTEDKILEVYGPPVQVAFQNGDKNGAMTPAGEAFLKKNHQKLENLQFREKQGKEVLFAVNVEKGMEVKNIIAPIVHKFLMSLHFGKHMRWGDVQEDFIRPVRNIAIFLDDIFVSLQAYGICGKPQTQLHRDFGFVWQEVKNFTDYKQKLAQGGVILQQDMRRELVLKNIESLQKTKKVFIEIDEELLDEVVAITECPRVMLGEFEKEFLKLPKEVIITSMKENQRYFAVYQEKNLQQLSHHFVMVGNATTQEEEVILSGNEKVLKARLKDAMFFYENDLKNGLSNTGLKNLIFIDGAGNMQDKVVREKQIAQILLTRLYGANKALKDKILECIEISKADLLSEMVYEFSNLQGVMGYYYALAMQKDSDVALGIKEQYLPFGEDSVLPDTDVGILASLAYRFDNILTLFSVGKIPTGSKDPFALRRMASGILKILIKNQFPFLLRSFLCEIVEKVGYKNIDIDKIFSFFIERMDGILMLNPVFLKSVLATQEEDINKIVAKTQAVNVVLSSNPDALTATFKRVANFLKAEIELQNIKPDLFVQKEEKSLYQEYEKIKQKDLTNYVEKIQNLCTLKPFLDRFFDNVMVNVDDEKIKNNRIQLITHIYKEFLEIADIKEIGSINN
ncbi:glycine--tRNA ligase subunit beta [Helicobacter sp. faydin-H8]|nr:glycine--tRNA ligase subunit beta [Helicobacter anatolicus]